MSSRKGTCIPQARTEQFPGAPAAPVSPPPVGMPSPFLSHPTKGQALGWLVILAAIILLCGAYLSSRQAVVRNELVVWSSFKEEELKVFREVCARFTEREKIPVRIVLTPFLELQPKLQVSVPVGQGPDLFTAPPDWIGKLVKTQVVRPLVADALPEAEMRQFLSVSLKAMQIDGQQYGLPLSVTALGLVTNRRLCPEPPKTFQELLVKAKERTHDDQYGFLFDTNDFYFAWPFFGGEGAYIFKTLPDGRLDPLDVGLGGDAAVRAAQLLSDLTLKEKLIPQGTDKNSANGKFLDGKCAMTITGPWSLKDYKDHKDKDGRPDPIDYVFTPIPPLENGRYPTSPVGVDGLLLTRCSRHPDAATRLMLALAGREAEVALHLAAGRVPARQDALADPRVASNPDVKAIGEAVEKGSPLPTITEAEAVWEPMVQALKLMNVPPGQPVRPTLEEATARIIAKIKRTRE